MVPKPIQDAGYTVVGLGVLALQHFHVHRHAARAHIESVVGEVRSVAEPIARRVGLDHIAAPVCSIVSGGRALIGSALRPGPPPADR